MFKYYIVSVINGTVDQAVYDYAVSSLQQTETERYIKVREGYTSGANDQEITEAEFNTVLESITADQVTTQ